MLEPEFYQVDEEFAQAIKQSGLSYRIMGYSRYSDYTLVKWSYGDEEEYFTGERLFLGTKEIASAAGSLGLEDEPEPDVDKSNYVPSVWDRVKSVKYGLSRLVAIALTSPENFVALEF